MSNKIEDSKTLIKNYAIVRLISQGGFGTVYEAINLLNSRRCAIKTIDIVNYKSNVFEFFLNEGRILRSILNHQHIIKLYNEKVFGTVRVLELELLQNSLFEIIKARTKEGLGFSEEDVRTIITYLLKGLQYLHVNDIVHRDLKPENIGFLKSSKLETLKIFDFGLSTQLSLEDSRMMHSVVGTVAYMAPEMFSMTEYNAVY